MEVIGILGGMGSYATLDLFRRVLEAFPADKEWERPRVIIDNNCTMPSRVRAILYDENREQLISEMCHSVNHLVECGATKILLGCITAHYFLEELPHREIIIDAAKETSKYISAGDVAVLCSEGTMEAGIWDRVLNHCHIIYPDNNQMLQLRKFIEIVKRGQMTLQSQKDFLGFIRVFPCERVVLGCTELPVLLGNMQMEKEILDPMQIAINCLK